jgi:outer membrane protein assembly factor BamE (lipoprotein component of BamABCDE complex)
MRKPVPSARRALLAVAPAFVIGWALLPAHAAAATATPDKQAQVRPGMTADEVTAVLGKPYKIRKYGKGESTWGYQTRQSETWFLVDFGADGKVKAAKEQYIAAF